jgi:hypothetical protein
VLLSAGIKRPKHEVDRSVTNSVEVKNNWSSTSTSAIRAQDVNTNNFTIALFYVMNCTMG